MPRALTLLLGLTLATAVPAGAGRPLPPDDTGARAALDASPRKSEWVEIAYGASQRLRAFVVYPGRALGAPVVVVIHGIDGLTDWVRAVGDHLAGEGFIAIVPDLVSGLGPARDGVDSPRSRDEVVALLGGLGADEVNRRLDAIRLYAVQIPAGNGRIATLGFGWGGTHSFGYAAHQYALDAAVVYCGRSPAPEDLERIEARVLGLYAGADDEVSVTIGPAAKKMKSLRRTYEIEVYEGAEPGFLRGQTGGNGANEKATEKAWDKTIKFLRKAFADDRF